MNARTLFQILGLLADAVKLPFRRATPAGSLSTDKDVRKNELHALAGSVTRTLAITKVRTLLQRGRREEIERAALERATKQAVEHLGQMKGLNMKLGQQMSYVNALPDEAEQQLAALQASVPPLEPDQLDAVLHKVFGRKLDRVFAEFQREPIAAASIGQVHRATLKDGRQVAVKLQYPGVGEAMRSDLANLESMTALSQLQIKTDLGEYMRSMNESFLRELDYTAEQRNQQRLADLYRDHPFVLVPATVPELCGKEVLVSEFVDGATLQDTARQADQASRDRLAEIMYRFAFGCIANGFFSGDPHPGNYLFPSGGRVAFLDFGMVIAFERAEHSGRISEVLAGALGDRPDLIEEGLGNLGLLTSGVDAQGLWTELQPLVAGPIQGGRVRFDREAYNAAMKGASDRKTSQLGKALSKSPELEAWMLFWLRYALGALATISKLAPEADWRAILEEIVLGKEPTGEIGRSWGDAPGGATFGGTRYEALAKKKAEATA